MLRVLWDAAGMICGCAAEQYCAEVKPGQFVVVDPGPGHATPNLLFSQYGKLMPAPALPAQSESFENPVARWAGPARQMNKPGPLLGHATSGWVTYERLEIGVPPPGVVI